MATYNVAAGSIAAHAKTLVAGVVDSVNFADNPETVEVVSDGADVICITVDGTAPVVAGDRTYVLPAVPCSRTVTRRPAVRLRLISPGAPTYSAMMVA